MDKNYWVEIAEIIKENYSDIDGFVVLHGSDTMAYSICPQFYVRWT